MSEPPGTAGGPADAVDPADRMDPAGRMDPANAAHPADRVDEATDAALRHWGDSWAGSVVPLSPPPYAFERVLVRAYRRKIRRRMIAATASALSVALIFVGLVFADVLPVRQSDNADCGNATSTLALAKGSSSVNRRTEYVIGGVLTAAALTAGILAGCTGGPSTPTAGGTGAGTPGGTASSGSPVILPSAPTSGATTKAATGAPSTTPASTPQCTTADLSGTVSLVAGSGAMGSESLNITLTNASNHTCTVYGFPGFKLEDKNQDAQTTKVTWDPAVAKKLITLSVGSSASTTARFDSGVPASGEPASGPCEPASFYMLITAPNNTTQLESQINGTGGNGITVCQYGALDVLALVPGPVGPNQ